MRNPFHQTAVTHKDVGEVTDNFVIRLIKLCSQRPFSYGHPNRVCESLTQWTRGGFHAWRVANFRMSWRLRVQLAEIL